MMEMQVYHIENLREVLKGALLCLHQVGKADLAEIETFASDGSIRRESLQKQIKHKLAEELKLVHIEAGAEKPYSLTPLGEGAVEIIRSCLEQDLQQHRIAIAQGLLIAQEWEIKIQRWLDKGAGECLGTSWCPSCGRLLQSKELDLSRARALLTELSSLLSMDLSSADILDGESARIIRAENPRRKSGASKNLI